MSWPTKALGDICDITVGRTPSRSNPEFWGSGEPWLSIADMNQGLVITETKEQITPTAAKAGKLVREGTVLLSFKLSIGKVAIAGRDLYTNEAIAALPIRQRQEILPDYLLRALQSLDLSGGANRAAMGATLNKAKLQQIQVPLPPFDEQQRIAAVLEQADNLRRKRRSVLDETEKLAQALFVDLFGDPIRNPRHLPVVLLGDVGELDRGVSRHRPRNDPALLGGPYPLIQTGDVARSGGLITDYSASYSELGLAQSKLWPAGTLCITIAANIAQTGVLSFAACFPDSVVGFTADKATTTYVRMWLTFLQPVLEASAPQSAQRNINLAILRALPVPLPALEEREAFDRLLRKVRDQQQSIVDAKNRDDDLFASLQYRAFSGRL